MNPARSRTTWEWCLLLSPAFEMMLVASLPERWAAHLFPGDRSYASLNAAICNLPIAGIMSLILGVWACWERPSLVERFVVGTGFGIVLGLVNVTIGFVGCMAGHTFFG